MGHGPALRFARDAIEVEKPKAQSWQGSPTAIAPIQPADAALYLLAVAGLDRPTKPRKSKNNKRKGRVPREAATSKPETVKGETRQQ